MNAKTTRSKPVELKSEFAGTIDEVLPFLFIGGRQGSKDKTALQKLNISHIVNVTDTPDLFPEDFKYLHCDALDEFGFDIAQFFDTAGEFILQAKQADSKVFVHCLAGQSRSATIVIAYLMKYEKMNLKDAYYHLKFRRPVARPNITFFHQLQKYEKSLFGEESLSESDYINNARPWKLLGRQARRIKKKLQAQGSLKG